MALQPDGSLKLEGRSLKNFYSAFIYFIMKQISTLFFLFLFWVSGFAQTENFINNNGDVICFTTFGTGFPVLIINGGPGMSSEGFMPLAKTIKLLYTTNGVQENLP